MRTLRIISSNANNAKDPQSSLSSTIARLSSKTGVVATVVIDSTLGSVIQSSGHYSASRAATVAKNSASVNSARPATENGLGQLAAGSSDLDGLAAMVWKYVKTTEALIADLDSEVRSLGIEELYCTLTGGNRMRSNSFDYGQGRMSLSLLRIQNTYSWSCTKSKAHEVHHLLGNFCPSFCGAGLARSFEKTSWTNMTPCK